MDNLLGSDAEVRVFARNCECRIVEDSEARSFIEKYHRQGVTQDKATHCGLYHHGELVGVISFCQPRTAAKRRRYSRELLRLCFKSGFRVIGGASKLFKFYVRTYEPADIFTYQDTTGESTTVYESCGMTFVKQSPKKQYFVAPNQTMLTGSRKEVLGAAYATRYGPDRILGTKLGEVFDSAGKRKSNRELFTQELGWHIEEASGDRVYEWINPNLTHYTYRITASDSDKYYYGVSHVKKTNATESDCLNDGYWGSGGSNSNNKFNRWKTKHSNNLNKEILEIFSLKSDAYHLESALVGDLYKTDPLCLNSVPGGKDGGINGWKQSGSLRKSTCKIHGESFFTGDRCRKCITATSITVKSCLIHGEVYHNGISCMSCISDKRITEGHCPTHGKGKFQGSKCYKCIMVNRSTVKDCNIHGRTTFSGSSCVKCYTQSVDKRCAIHGMVAHIGDSCMSCRNESLVSLKVCEKHGETKFKGGSCYKCSGEKSSSQQVCQKHGLTTFRKGACSKCKFEKNISIEHCSVHGDSKHIKGICYKCRGEKSAHNTHHQQVKSENCRLCVEEEVG